jgi:putative transcriptional regulator
VGSKPFAIDSEGILIRRPRRKSSVRKGVARCGAHATIRRVRPTEPNRLREFREAAGFTQQQLADEVSADRSTIIRAEQGTQQPTLGLADRLADALETTVDALFSVFDRETPAEAYERGRRDRRGAPVEADTTDPYGIAAFVDDALKAKPSAYDPVRVWRVSNPRGTSRKLDAVVAVQVVRRPPWAAAQLYEWLVNE